MRLGLPRLRKSGNKRRLDSLPTGAENQGRKNYMYQYFYLQLKSLKIAIDLTNLIV